ncbi:hypothetical protein YB2330_005176 [Saitoella coloradoensis]
MQPYMHPVFLPLLPPATQSADIQPANPKHSQAMEFVTKKTGRSDSSSTEKSDVSTASTDSPLESLEEKEGQESVDKGRVNMEQGKFMKLIDDEGIDELSL